MGILFVANQHTFGRPGPAKESLRSVPGKLLLSIRVSQRGCPNRAEPHPAIRAIAPDHLENCGVLIPQYRVHPLQQSLGRDRRAAFHAPQFHGLMERHPSLRQALHIRDPPQMQDLVLRFRAVVKALPASGTERGIKGDREGTFSPLKQERARGTSSRAQTTSGAAICHLDNP